MRRIPFVGLALLLTSACPGSLPEPPQPTGDAGGDATRPDAMPDSGADAGFDGPVSKPGPTAPAPAAACPRAGGAAVTTWDNGRPTMPWKYDPQARASTPDRSPALAPCAPEPAGGLRCRGLAHVVIQDKRILFVLAQGATLGWNDAAGAAVGPPPVTAGGTVFLDYWWQRYSVCPFCGGYERRSLAVFDKEGGRALWAGRVDHRGEDLDDELTRAIFGVTARRQPACSARFENTHCFRSIDRIGFDHVLATTPEQTIAYGTPTRVATANGTYDVVWAASTETSEHDPNCADGPAVAGDNAYAIRLVP